MTNFLSKMFIMQSNIRLGAVLFSYNSPGILFRYVMLSHRSTYNLLWYIFLRIDYWMKENRMIRSRTVSFCWSYFKRKLLTDEIIKREKKQKQMIKFSVAMWQSGVVSNRRKKQICLSNIYSVRSKTEWSDFSISEVNIFAHSSNLVNRRNTLTFINELFQRN